MEVHIVVKGDTLWKIARQYGIPFEDLKRVNAHLANPDYIVPGMKIFLPKRQHNAEHPEKGKGPVTPHPPKGTKPSPPIPVPKPPTSKPPTPKPIPVPIPPAPAPRPPTPKPPTPRPPAPTPRPPTPVPPSKPTPPPPPAVQPTVPAPIPLPTPTPTPTPMPMPMHPPQTFAHPMIGIPCGWMPIFDADCFPFMHSGQIQAMPRQEQPMHHAPLPSTQFPMYEQESPIFSGQGPATSPLEIPMVEGWQLLESPDFMFEETAEMVMQPAAEYSPEYMYEESPEIDLKPSAPCPPGPGYVPQAISPAVQGQWNPGQFGYPAMPQPGYHQGCGCEGQHQQHRQQMMVPIFYGHPCNCPSCMQQATPYSGMPPNQGSNWFGAY
ncbi:LysM peptidoglycan-binding domain-containing protein [Sporosarcina sp. FSL K6-5500]|uniref:LysM peptidoglycan-binding domain-containing protein n=1 Tax=Sporosarcina sp. FSL K6-5500 TaxID=2921558 RepID=UPI0030F6D8EE